MKIESGQRIAIKITNQYLFSLGIFIRVDRTAFASVRTLNNYINRNSTLFETTNDEKKRRPSQLNVLIIIINITLHFLTMRHFGCY